MEWPTAALIAVTVASLIALAAGVTVQYDFTRECATKGGQVVRLDGGPRVCVAKVEVLK